MANRDPTRETALRLEKTGLGQRGGVWGKSAWVGGYTEPWSATGSVICIASPDHARQPE